MAKAPDSFNIFESQPLFMKMFLLLLFFAGMYSSSVMAATAPSSVAPKSIHVILPENKPKAVHIRQILSLTPDQYKNLTGKKLRLKDRIMLKFLQCKTKKQLNKPADITKLKKLGILSLIFGVLGFIFIFMNVGILGIIGVGLAIAGLILGIKSLKGNTNVPGIIGIVFSGLVLFLILLLVVLLASSDWWF